MYMSSNIEPRPPAMAEQTQFLPMLCIYHVKHDLILITQHIIEHFVSTSVKFF